MPGDVVEIQGSIGAYDLSRELAVVEHVIIRHRVTFVVLAPWLGTDAEWPGDTATLPATAVTVLMPAAGTVTT
jgi:hypothetical protein